MAVYGFWMNSDGCWMDFDRFWMDVGWMLNGFDGF